MARVLGYGGLANTNGARSFAGKVEAAVLDDSLILISGDGPAPIVTTLGIDSNFNTIVRKYQIWALFAGTYTLLKGLLT